MIGTMLYTLMSQTSHHQCKEIYAHKYFVYNNIWCSGVEFRNWKPNLCLDVDWGFSAWLYQTNQHWRLMKACVGRSDCFHRLLRKGGSNMENSFKVPKKKKRKGQEEFVKTNLYSTEQWSYKDFHSETRLASVMLLLWVIRNSEMNTWTSKANSLQLC